MAGFIFYLVIIIIFAVVKAQLRQKNRLDDEMNQVPRSTPSVDQLRQFERSIVQQANTSQDTRTTQATRPASPARTAQSVAQRTSVDETMGEKKKSTTELLNEKAMEDQKQHQIEERQHAMEERRIHGNLRYAGRHYPGDPIPKGKREVICNYCNAENLVPASDFTTKYNCYFCRELL